MGKDYWRNEGADKGTKGVQERKKSLKGTKQMIPR
jgi:hypothetical protein